MKKKSPQDSEEVRKPRYGIMQPLLDAMGGLAKVLESRDTIDQLKEMADKDLTAVFTRILTEPTDVPNWQDQIALLLGEAKAIVKYQERFTIKER